MGTPADTFVVKDSGKRAEFTTGAVRDTEDGKPRYDLIPDELLDFLALEYAKGDPLFRPDLIPHALIRRLGRHLGKGALKYTDRNWEKGIPTKRLISSGLRHAVAWKRRKNDEDHASAAVFNIAADMHFQELGGNPADRTTAASIAAELNRAAASVCTHPSSAFVYHPDPSGNNDSFYDCGRCGKSLSFQERNAIRAAEAVGTQTGANR